MRISFLLALLAVAPLTQAAEPAIRNINLRGLQIGGATTLVVDGDDLGAAPKLLLPFPAQQELKAGTTDKQATFAVQLAGDVMPGFYQLRVVTDGGASLPVLIGVDKLPEQAFAPAIEQLPTALHSAVGGSGILETKFKGQAGQKLLIEVEAQRLGSKLRPILHLYGPDRRQIAWSWPNAVCAGDTLLEAALPVDGEYTVALHDAEYGPPGPGFFRLKIGDWKAVEQVFPPALGKGQSLAFELLGRGALTPLNLPAVAQAGPLPLPMPADANWSGKRPFVTVTSLNETVESPTKEPVQELPSLPAGVSGRLASPFEEDRYRMNVSPGVKLRFEVFAERLNSPLDSAIIVRNEKGDVLARGEDSPGTIDPVLDFVVPANVPVLLVGVADPQGRGSPRGVYRLTAEQLSPGAGPSDFALSTSFQRISVPLGGKVVLPIYVERRGYEGPIDLRANLPAGMQLTSAQIRPETHGALVIVERNEAPAEATLTSFIGKGATGDERAVNIKGHPLLSQQPWLASEIAVAPLAAKAADFAIDWRDLPADAALVPAGKLALPFRIQRLDEKTLVRLTLVTSQSPPFVNNQPDLNRTLRAEKPVELAADMKEGEVTVLIPPDLSSPDYEVTLQAELLPPDRRTVLATAYAPVRRLAVKHQLAIVLASPPRLEANLDTAKGAMLKIDGKIERRDGWTGDVAITLTGLPAGVAPPAANVKADAVDFSLALNVPANLASGDYHDIKLSASGADMKQPNIRIKSRDIALILAAKPAPPQP